MYIKKPILLILAIFICHITLAQNKTGKTNITLRAVPGLKFDQLRFSVKPGAQVTLTLINNDDMDHNVLITRPGKRQEVVDAAAALQDKGPQMDFIPDSESVLWSIPVISPGESVSINFTAPTKTGAYPYVCTYPGHGFIMFGVMHVTNNDMPPLAEDPDVPTAHQNGIDNDHTNHSERPTPFLYRTFIDDIGPAVIAVRLTNKLSYAWDAAECRFRYAWTGEFLNMEKLWAGHKQATAIVLGNKIWVEESYPLRVGAKGNIPDVKFKGYKLIDGYPEFHYTINGVEVYEFIKEAKDGKELIRSFRIPDATQTVWFNASANHTIHASTTGKWSNGILELSPDEAKSFKIIMTKKK